MALVKSIATCYKHVQNDPASEWTLVHNIGGYPIVDVFTEYGGELVKIMPASVTYIDGNTCTLTFSTPRTGFATVV